MSRTVWLLMMMVVNSSQQDDGESPTDATCRGAFDFFFIIDR